MVTLQKKSVMHTVQRMKHLCSILINGVKQSYSETGPSYPCNNNELHQFIPAFLFLIFLISYTKIFGMIYAHL